MSNLNFESLYSCRNVLALDAMTALYCRLSVDDANDGDSNSIQNQKKILLNYAKENGYTNYQFFVDDGYSGTTFDRPDFQRMIEGIKAGIIKRVIIKDMSRFGRDYLQVGIYTEVMFAEYDIHFIAVNDGVDSQKGENDLTPFRNLFNEWYARDCSKKQRAVKRMKGMAGERIATQAPYGYIKGENGKLVVDEETAPVVKLIFDLRVQGLGVGKIASELTRRKIPTPGTIEYRRTGKNRRYLPDAEYVWSAATITVLLQHKEYLGCTVNFKTYSKSYKLKKRHPTPENQQMVFENTHEAIITQEVWETVQRLHQHRRRSPKSEVPSLFSGILYCADCGAPLHFSSGNTTSGKDPRYICGSYRKRSVEKCCTAHYIRLAVLEELVLENLRQVVRFATDQEDEFAKLIMNRTLSKNDADLKLMQKEISAKEHRITELDKIIKKLYEDNFSGKLSDERYMIFSRDYENEQHTLRTEVDSLKLQIQEQDSKVVNINSFVEIAKKYTSFEKLTPGMLHELVEKIVVHEGDKSSGHRIQKIDIYYSFVGDLESSHVVAQRTLKNEVA